MKRYYLLTSALITAGSSVHAQEFTYGQLYVGSTEFQVDGLPDTNVDFYGGGLEFVANSFTFSLDATRLSTDVGDLDFASIAVEYGFPYFLSLGIDHTRIEFEDLDASINSIYAIYEQGPFAIGGSIGDSSDLEDEAYGVFASFDVTEGGTVGIEYLNLDELDVTGVYWDYEAANYEVFVSYLDLEVADTVVLEGSFDISERWSITGGYADFSSDIGGGDTYSIGAKFGISDTVSVNASYGQLSLDGVSEDADVISFGLEYEMGKRTSARSTFTDLVGRSGNAISGTFGY